MADGLGCAHLFVGLRNPRTDQLGAATQFIFNAAKQSVKMIRDISERVVIRLRPGCEGTVIHGLGAVIHGEHGGDVGVRHEAGECAEDEVVIIRAMFAAAFRVSDGYDAIQVFAADSRGLETFFQGAHEAGGAGAGAEQDDVIARACAAIAGTRITHKSARVGHERDLLTGPEAGFIQGIGLEVVAEIRCRR